MVYLEKAMEGVLHPSQDEIDHHRHVIQSVLDLNTGGRSQIGVK